ncbi:cytidine deaminase [Bacillus daqingensis]|uniref:Cytidine deaminase n=1 Tax=Bacillus daqingensis TaxID=872396 RepID=A0ABV9NXC1_9BACI
MRGRSQRLIDAAQQVIQQNDAYGRHHVGAAVRTSSGSIFTGIHLEANVGRIAVCAEAVALGKALTAGERGLEAVVAVAHPHPHEEGGCWVVAPCGMCRELISDYAADAEAIIPYQSKTVVCSMLDLLPEKYS